MTETAGNRFIEQSRRDLAGGMSASIVLTYAKHHLGALQALHLMTDERVKAIRETVDFIRELEITDEEFPSWVAIPELKACPHCGHHACFTDSIHGEFWGQWDYRVWCSSSHCRAEIRLPALPGNKMRLIAKWNRRP